MMRQFTKLIKSRQRSMKEDTRQQQQQLAAGGTTPAKSDKTSEHTGKSTDTNESAAHVLRIFPFAYIYAVWLWSWLFRWREISAQRLHKCAAHLKHFPHFYHSSPELCSTVKLFMFGRISSLPSLSSAQFPWRKMIISISSAIPAETQKFVELLVRSLLNKRPKIDTFPRACHLECH